LRDKYLANKSSENVHSARITNLLGENGVGWNITQYHMMQSVKM